MKTAIIKVNCSNRKEYWTMPEGLQQLKRYSPRTKNYAKYLCLIHKMIL